MDTPLKDAVDARIAAIRDLARSAEASREANYAAADGALRQYEAALAIAMRSEQEAALYSAEADRMQASLDALIESLVEHGLYTPEPDAPSAEIPGGDADLPDDDPALSPGASA